MGAAAIPWIMGGLGALTGLFGNRSQTATTTKKGSSTQTETPNLTYEQQLLLSRLMPSLFQQLQGPDLGGYEATGMANINKQYDVRNKALENILAAKGLGQSPLAASVMAGSEAGRLGDITTFRNQLPLQRYQMRNQALGNLSSLFSALPTGRTLTGNYDETATTKGPSNMLGGMFGGAGSLLAPILGQKYGRSLWG